LIAGVAGENVKFAAAGGSVVETLIVLDEVDDCLLSLVTVSVTVNVPPRVYRWIVVTPDPVAPSPKSHAYVALVALDDEPLKETSWLMVGLVGEYVKRATVATVLGKSSTVNETYVVASCESTTLFSDDSVPVLVSLAVNVTSARGVGAVPLEKTLPFDSGSLRLNDWVCPAATWPRSLPFANA